MTGRIEGRCLCGAVRISVRGLSHEMSACHCEMCRRWSGAVQFGIDAPTNGTEVVGPVKVYRSSAIAERAWCDTCGSALWLRDLRDGAPYELVPGLFANAGGARLVREVYADRIPDGYALAGTHRRVTAAEYALENPVVEEAE